MKSLPVIYLVLGLLWISADYGYAARQGKSKTEVAAFVNIGFEPGIPGLLGNCGVSQDSILTRFGQPVKTSKKQKTREPAGVALEYLSFEYSGLIIELARRLDSQETWITSIELSNPTYLLKYGLRVGQAKSAFTKVLGAPYYEDVANQFISYEARAKGYPPNQVTIRFDQDDRAKEITWVCQVD